MKIKKATFFTPFLLFSLFLPQFLSSSIMVSPVRFEVAIKRGKTFTDAIRVRNMKSSEINVKVYVSDFYLNEEGSLTFIKEGTHKNSISRWIRVNPTQFTLKADEEKWVRFSIRMPEKVDGELHGMIFFQTIPTGLDRATGKQVFISTRIGAVVYASPGENIPKSAEISDFLVKENPMKSLLDYAIIFQNKGKIHVRPKGKLKIIDTSGRKIATSVLNEQGSPILRENIRIFKGQVGSDIKPGTYKIIAELDYGGKAKLEAEKSLTILPGIKIESFEAKVLNASEKRNDKSPSFQEKYSSSQSKIIFSVKVNGLQKEEELDRSFVRVKDLTGNLVAQIPLKVKSIAGTMNLEGEWNKAVEKGIYFSELALLPRGKKALTSYVKFVVNQ